MPNKSIRSQRRTRRCMKSVSHNHTHVKTHVSAHVSAHVKAHVKAHVTFLYTSLFTCPYTRPYTFLVYRNHAEEAEKVEEERAEHKVRQPRRVSVPSGTMWLTACVQCAGALFWPSAISAIYDRPWLRLAEPDYSMIPARHPPASLAIVLT